MFIIIIIFWKAEPIRSFDLPFDECPCSPVTVLSCGEGDDLSTWLLCSLCQTQGLAALLSSLSGNSEGNCLLSSPAFWTYFIMFWFSDPTVILSGCPSLPFWLPFSFGVCAFPPAASAYSFHVPSFVITWC